MIDAANINPEAVYDDGSICAALGLSPGALTRARREGTLRFSRKGRRTFYLGRWILDWLAADVEQGARA